MATSESRHREGLWFLPFDSVTRTLASCLLQHRLFTCCCFLYKRVWHHVCLNSMVSGIIILIKKKKRPAKGLTNVGTMKQSPNNTSSSQMLLPGYGKSADLLHSSAGAISITHSDQLVHPRLMPFLAFCWLWCMSPARREEKSLSQELYCRLAFHPFGPVFLQELTHTHAEMLKPSAQHHYWLRRNWSRSGLKSQPSGNLILPLPLPSRGLGAYF